jgi:hypothetical protein
MAGALRRARAGPTTPGRSNHLMAREVGLPLMRGLLAFATRRLRRRGRPALCRCVRGRSAWAAATPSAT